MRLNSKYLNLKFIIRNIYLRFSAREAVRLTQYHRQTAVRDVDAVFSAGEYGGDLWIQPLSDAVADRPRGGGRESVRTARIDDLNGVVVDIYPRSDLSKREVTVY